MTDATTPFDDELVLLRRCATSDKAALEEFRAKYFPIIGHAARAAGAQQSEIEDLQHYFLQWLFFPGSGKPAKFESYSGRGSFGGWLRVVVGRHVLAQRARSRREVPLVREDLSQLLVGRSEPELLFARNRYSGAFKEAFEQAVTSLSQEDRVLLRQHTLDGLSMLEIATIHRVHPSTITRRFAQVRERLLEETRNRLSIKTGVRTSRALEIIQAIRSRVNLSLSRLLRSNP